nr:HAD family hydrolase [Actinomyces bowdenii]
MCASPVKLVTIDLWGTLIKAESGLSVLMADFLASHSGLSPAETAAILHHLGKALDAAAVHSGVDIPSRDKLGILLRECGIRNLNSKQLELVLVEHVTRTPLRLCEPECVEILERIADRGIRIAYASNSGFIGGQIMRSELRRFNLLDDRGTRWCAFSDELGIAKPNPKFFNYVRRRFAANTVVHVGDNIVTDFLGAANSGIYPMLVDRSVNPRKCSDHLAAGSLVSLFNELLENIR